MLSGVACGSDDESGCCRCHGSVVQFSSVCLLDVMRMDACRCSDEGWWTGGVCRVA